jgi:hypothetical protein
MHCFVEVKIPLGKPKCKWDDNSKRDKKEMEWESVVWIRLDQ